MFRACIYFKGNLDKYFSLVEFSYNNSFLSAFSMCLYETLYFRSCRSSFGLFDVGETSLHGPNLIYKTLEKVHIISNKFQTTYCRQ